MNRRENRLTRRGRLVLRAGGVIAAAAIAFIVGAARGASYEPSRDSANSFLDAWERNDLGGMYAQLSKDAQARYPQKAFAKAYSAAAKTATSVSIEAGGAQGPAQFGSGKAVTAPVLVHTRAFGAIEAQMVLPLAGHHIAWAPNLVFPGLQPGEHLERRSDVPTRAAMQARDGKPLAIGPGSARAHPLGAAAEEVAGQMGRPDAGQTVAMSRVGFPPFALAGISGLEKAFNLRLAGQPGGELLATGNSGSHALARGEPRPAKPLRTTIDAKLQQAAYDALGGRVGGVAVLDAKNGEVRALAGAAFSAPQPPGSTFKMITTTAALEAGVIKLSDQFPSVQSANVGGRAIANAHDEFCGGTFKQAFARSCNSVFAPLGPKIGNDRLVTTAERYGFNAKPQLYNAAATAAVNPPESTIPNPVGSDLDLGVSAIGQGKILATPLEMASVAQTVANDGVRSPTPIVTEPSLRPAAKPVRVTSAQTAATLKDLMLGVVSSQGTGFRAAIPGIKVAGKTGTAELGPKPGQSEVGVLGPNGEQQQGKPEQILDAWFAAFAPANRPKLAVCVLIANADADGGEAAAPVAREILAAGL